MTTTLDRLPRRVGPGVDRHPRRKFGTGRALGYDGLIASVIVSDLANLEVCAVISRQLRARRFTRAAAAKAYSDFDALRATSEPLSHSAQDFAIADRLVRDYSTKLSASDALHLASAKNAGAMLATFDARLAEAARGQGVAVAELG